LSHLDYTSFIRVIRLDKETNIFNWNDLVVVTSNPPNLYPSGTIAVVCGMEQIKSEKLANKFNLLIGDWIYTIEFGDGSSIEIPERYLEKYVEPRK
jgi:hypothetical protein